MADLISLPCTRCGKPASLPVGESPTGLLCARCLAGTNRYVVQMGSTSRDFDGEALLAAIQKGEITALDWVARVGEAARPIAAHPDFRIYFMPGADIRPAGAAPARPARQSTTINWAGIFRFVGGAVLLGAIAGGAWLWYQLGPSLGEVKETVRSTVAPVLPGNDAITPISAPVERLDPRADPLIRQLLTRVGEVEEPRTLLMAQAWVARTRPETGAMETALGLAERAVARAPDSPDALALLAEILADLGREPQLRAALIKVARSLAPNSVAWHRAAAASALADGKASDAAEHLAACLGAAPEDLPCQFLDLRLSAATNGPGALPGFDKLAAAWPENLRVDRSAAILAAQADAPDAVARVQRARSRVKVDADLDGATALLRFRDGAVTQARAMAAKIGERASIELALTAGEAAIVAGAPADAIRWVERTKDGVLSGPQSDRAHLLLAQGRYLQARSDASFEKDAREAAAELAKVDGASPASTQVRALIAGLGGKPPGDVWSGMEAKGADAIDVHRAWLGRASLALARGDIKDALTSAEQARIAAPHEAEAYLWGAAAAVAGADAGKAIELLQRGLLARDARSERRNPIGGALPIPADTGALQAQLDAALTARPSGKLDPAFATAAVAALAGDGKAALAAYPKPKAEHGAAGIALVARANLLTKNAAGAVAALNQADASMAQEPGLATLRVEAALLAGASNGAATAAVATLLGTSPKDAYYHGLKAELARLAGDRAAARAEAEVASRADPRDSEARRLYRALLTSGA